MAGGDEVALAAVAVVVAVEGLVQNFLEGVGRVRIMMMGAQMWEGGHGGTGCGGTWYGGARWDE